MTSNIIPLYPDGNNDDHGAANTHNPHHKSSLSAERLKFGKDSREVEAMRREADYVIEDYPLDEWALAVDLTPTVEEAKALTAIQAMFGATGYDEKGMYKGNLTADDVEAQSLLYVGLMPKLAFTLSEYLDAYGVKRDGRGWFNRRQADRAIAALGKLREQRRIVWFKPVTGKRGEKLVHAIATERPLVHFVEGYLYLTMREQGRVQERADFDRAARLVVQLDPLFLTGLDRFYTLKPDNLHAEIEDYIAQRRGKRARISRTYSLFIEYLLTMDMPEFRVTRETLITKLYLEGQLEKKGRAKVDGFIDECLDLAQGLGYLLSWREEKTTRGDKPLLNLRLNPKRCSRVRHAIEAGRGAETPEGDGNGGGGGPVVVELKPAHIRISAGIIDPENLPRII